MKTLAFKAYLSKKEAQSSAEKIANNLSKKTGDHYEPVIITKHADGAVITCAGAQLDNLIIFEIEPDPINNRAFVIN